MQLFREAPMTSRAAVGSLSLSFLDEELCACGRVEEAWATVETILESREGVATEATVNAFLNAAIKDLNHAAGIKLLECLTAGCGRHSISQTTFALLVQLQAQCQ